MASEITVELSVKRGWLFAAMIAGFLRLRLLVNLFVQWGVKVKTC
jgi:hypothetical protein